MSENNSSLHPALWLFIPLAILIAQIGIELFVPHQYLGALHSENGPHETLQFIFAFIAMIYAFRCLFKIIPQKQPLLTFWIICFCLGCAYIAGEEISWGQHVFEWGTPDFWSGVNDQNETNLHNTTSWLDQKPRAILLIGIIVGGLIIPALKRFSPQSLPKQFSIIYPSAILSLTAFLTIAVKITDKMDKNIESIHLLSRGSEVEELYLFYFVMLYLMLLLKRIKMLDAK